MPIYEHLLCTHPSSRHFRILKKLDFVSLSRFFKLLYETVIRYLRWELRDKSNAAIYRSSVSSIPEEKVNPKTKYSSPRDSGKQVSHMFIQQEALNMPSITD